MILTPVLAGTLFVPQAIHSCAVKFPEVAGSVVHVLMDFLGDANTGRRLGAAW